mgnify:CR=1 FL=1
MCKEECKSEEMKYRLAEAVKVCMKTTSVEKITVKEIVDACGTTRQTFYRHFQDKYDLVNWYFDKILLESFEHMGEGETIYEGLVKKFQYIQKEKLFFKMAFKSDDQNCLRDHDFELILAFYSDRIQEKSGTDPVSRVCRKPEICENIMIKREFWAAVFVSMEKNKERKTRLKGPPPIPRKEERRPRIIPMIMHTTGCVMRWVRIVCFLMV